MKRTLTVGVVVLLLVVPAAYGLVLHARAGALAHAHDAGAKALGSVVVTHASTQPLHDNGVACLAGLAQVLPPDHAPFGDPLGAQAAQLKAFIDERQGHFEALPQEIRDPYARLHPWVASMRECASSAKLQLVDGLRPADAKREGGPFLRTRDALDTFFDWQVTELVRMAADAAPAGLRLERCGPALTLAADASFLGGARGLSAGYVAAWRLVPLCGDALAAATPEERAAAGKAWSNLTARLVSKAHLVRWERYGDKSWSLARPVLDRPESFFEHLERGWRWARWDAQLARLEAAAGGDEAAWQAALDAFAREGADPGVEQTLRFGGRELERMRTWLEVLVAVAQGDAQPRPHVTREGGELRIELPDAPAVKFKLLN